ncbi:hypothetical protein VKS41_004313 [Umbelopsis sp. WA50703]
MHSILPALLIAYLVALVAASGPGSHRYQMPHSNYGDEKKNQEHIKEHLKDLPVDKANMDNLDEKDTLFYLFSMHDYNKDGFLDGHELRAAFTDFDHDEDVSELISLDEVTEMVDHVLEEDDLNGDGLISWEEYLESQTYHGAV